MKTTLLIKQHQKCQNILEMIDEIDFRIHNHRINMDWCVEWNKERIVINKAIRYRLINYYENTFTKMCQQVQINETA